MSATLSRCANRSKSHRSVYEIVTDKILTALQQGVVPWRRPWSGEQAAPKSAATGRLYRGVNAFLLALQADAAGYESPYWLAYRQAQKLGGQVRKGEQATQSARYRGKLGVYVLDVGRSRRQRSKSFVIPRGL